MISVGMFIIISLIVVVLFMSYAAIKTALDYLHRPRPVTMHTDLATFKESQTVDNKVKRNGHRLKQSPTAVFEDMCVVNPTEAEGLEDVAEDYRRVLRGEVLDAQGKHAPSEFLNGERNPDYHTYLINQTRALNKRGMVSEWIEKESARLEEALEYEEIKKGFIETLIGTYRFPYEVVPFAVTEERMENFDEKQWRKLAQSARSYASEFDLGAVSAFFMSIEDYDTLTNYDLMEKYASWHEHGVPITVNKENIMGRISDETLIEIVRLVDDEAYDWNEALQKVLNDNVLLLKEEELKRKYRDMVERR